MRITCTGNVENLKKTAVKQYIKDVRLELKFLRKTFIVR